MATDAERLIEIALKQVGNGPSKYRNWYYGYEGYGIPWCAVFVSWCFNQIGGINKYIVRTDGAGSIPRETLATGLGGTWYESEYSDSSTTPKPGDVIDFVWNYAGRYYSQDRYFSDHVGLVYKVDSNYVYTVEGNAGASNDTSSVKLKAYDRESGCINGYFRPNWKDQGSSNNSSSTQEVEEMLFKKGDKSDGVLALKALIQQGYSVGVLTHNVDNSSTFEDGTDKAVREIQKNHNLLVDGIAGPLTIGALREDIEGAIKALQRPQEIKSGWGIGVRLLKICLRVFNAAGIIKAKPDEKFGFGNGTRNATKEFQKYAGIDVDGIAGVETASAIEKELMKLIKKDKEEGK